MWPWKSKVGDRLMQFFEKKDLLVHNKKLGFARIAELSANDGVVILCRIKWNRAWCVFLKSTSALRLNQFKNNSKLT